MKLSEILCITRELLDDQTSDAYGRDAFWSDQRLVELLAAGERLFCMETGFIMDNGQTEDVTSLSAQAGTNIYTLSDSIIRVFDLRVNDRSLCAAPYLSRPLYSTDPWTPPVDNTSVYRLDTLSRSLDIRYDFDGTETISLWAWRGPVARLSVANTNTSPEIPAHFHQALPHYAAWKAYLQHDSDTYDPQQGRENAAEFVTWVRQARSEYARIHNNQPEFSVGGNGWSW